MPRRQRRAGVADVGERVAAQGPEDRHADVVERLTQQLLVPGGGNPVQDDTAEPEQLVVRAETVHQRGHRLPHGADVDDEDHGRAQQPGDLGGRLAVRAAGEPVEEPHGPLDHGDVQRRGTVGEQRAHPLGADHARVEVTPGTTRSQTQIGGVDVVGADLESGGPVTPGRQRGQQTYGDGSLAVTGGWRADHQPRDGAHDAPLALGQMCVPDDTGWAPQQLSGTHRIPCLVCTGFSRRPGGSATPR